MKKNEILIDDLHYIIVFLFINTIINLFLLIFIGEIFCHLVQ